MAGVSQLGGGVMGTVGAAIVLGLIVAALLRWRVVKPLAAILCVLFGLILGTTPIGGTVTGLLARLGAWLTGQLGAL